MRRRRRVRPPRSRQSRLSVALRAPAPRSGGGRDHLLQRPDLADPQRHGVGRRYFRRETDPPAGRDERHRPQPLLDRRLDRTEERSASAGQIHSRFARDRAQRQPDQRRTTSHQAGVGRIDLPVHRRYRGHSASDRRLARRHADRPHHRRPEPSARRLLAGLPERGSSGRGARPVRLPPPGVGAHQERRPPRVRGDVGDLRPGPDRGHVRARGGSR